MTDRPDTCPYCDAPVEFRESSEAIYHGRDFGPVYACSRYPECDAYVGCHPGTDKALGRLADAELRLWKNAAHAVFDPLWDRKWAKCRRERGADYKKAFARGSGYKWLADQLGIDRQECHIGMFDAATCKRVVELCLPYHKTVPFKVEKAMKMEKVA